MEEVAWERKRGIMISEPQQLKRQGQTNVKESSGRTKDSSWRKYEGKGRREGNVLRERSIEQTAEGGRELGVAEGVR